MSTQENKTLARRWFELMGGDGASLGSLVTDEWRFLDPASPELEKGPRGAAQLQQVYSRSFPDMRFGVDEQVARHGDGPARARGMVRKKDMAVECQRAATEGIDLHIDGLLGRRVSYNSRISSMHGVWREM